MIELFSERNGLRKGIKATDIITTDVYRMLFDCCEKNLDNLGYKYPDYCPDDDNCSIICGVDVNKLYSFLKYRIPNLFREGSNIVIPNDSDEYDQYALLDFIEYIAQNMRTIVRDYYHSYFRHHHLSFKESTQDFVKFRDDINEIFIITGLQYRLTEQRQIERITETDYLVNEVKESCKELPDQGVKELLLEAIDLYKSARPSNHRLATEKAWDALERLKTIYMKDGLDKKRSADNVIEKMSMGNTNYKTLFCTEFKHLTDIGNQYRIRHHETDRIDINDDRYYDYFFNRCMSLIALAIKFI